ncbi:MAG: isochorismatase family protein, partial [Bifidobacterium sp.]|nr:isochorismatase family protein [Bifidobacterium sp.]
VLTTVLAAADNGVAVRVAADACAGSSPENHQMALSTMALFTPLVTVTDTDSIVG